MQQDLRPHLLGGDAGDLEVSAVHGIAGLEGHDLVPALLREERTQLGRRVMELRIEELPRHLQTVYASTYIMSGWAGEQAGHEGMRFVTVTKESLGHGTCITLPDLAHFHHREHSAFDIPQAQVTSFLGRPGGLLVDFEIDRHGPKAAVGQAHLVKDALRVRAIQEAGQRSERAVHQQFEITDLHVAAGGEKASHGCAVASRRPDPH